MKFNTRQFWINCACFAVLGFTLSSGGITSSMWQFWVIVFTATAIEINADIK